MSNVLLFKKTLQLLCALCVAGAGAWEASGRLEAVMRCEAQGGVPSESFLLHPGGQQPPLALSFGSEANPPLGRRIRVWGDDADATGMHHVSRWTLAAPSLRESRRRAARVAPVDPAVLLVRVQIAGHTPVCSESALAGIMWHGASNARDFWREMSLGQIEFANDANGDGQDDVVTVQLDSPPLECFDVWPVVKLALANQHPELEVTAFKRHLMMLPEDYRACGWASASIGCDELEGCRLHLTACTNYPDSIVHELGHTLGLRHGAGLNVDGVVDDYEDRSTVMGYSYPAAPRRGLNSVHRMQLGLRQGNTVELEPGWSGSMQLAPLAQADSDDSPLIKVVRTSGGLYLSYRVALAGTYESDLDRDLGGRLGPHYDHVLQVHSSQLAGHSFVVGVMRQGDAAMSIAGGELRLLSTSQEGCTFAISSPPACGNGRLEPGEQCDGGPCCDENCNFRAAGLLCRGPVSQCDLAERCTGMDAHCPEDEFVPTGTLCRNSTGDPCDAPSYCSSQGLCPQSGIPNGAPCPVADCDTGGLCFEFQCMSSCQEGAAPAEPSAPAPDACGDSVCGAGEDCKSCPSDCPEGTSFCCEGSYGCLGRACKTGNALVEMCNLAEMPAAAPEKCFAGQCA